MLGGTGNNDATGEWSPVNFWTKLGSNAGNLVKVRDAWLAAADAIWLNDTVIRSKFSVIDPDEGACAAVIVYYSEAYEKSRPSAAATSP